MKQPSKKIQRQFKQLLNRCKKDKTPTKTPEEEQYEFEKSISSHFELRLINDKAFIRNKSYPTKIEGMQQFIKTCSVCSRDVYTNIICKCKYVSCNSCKDKDKPFMLCDSCGKTCNIITNDNKLSAVCSQCNLKEEKEEYMDNYKYFPTFLGGDMCNVCKSNIINEVNEIKHFNDYRSY